MREIGIDISSKRPKMLLPEMLESADKIITMNCSVEGVSPASLGLTDDWQLEDPEGKPIEKVRKIRHEIEAKVKQLLIEMEVIYEKTAIQK